MKLRAFTIINIFVWVFTITLIVVAMVTNEQPCEDAHTYQVLAECTDTSDGGAMLTDTEGQMWYVDLPLTAGDEYLLCINDNATIDVEDDIILNVWREVCA